MQALPYLLLPVLAGLLVTAQAMWGTAIKHQHVFTGSTSKIALNILSNPRMWFGGVLYIIATLVYFYMLSKLKFFSVQVSMTALSIFFSTLLSIIVFKETPDTINVIGELVVVVGAVMVLYK